MQPIAQRHGAFLPHCDPIGENIPPLERAQDLLIGVSDICYGVIFAVLRIHCVQDLPVSIEDGGIARIIRRKGKRIRDRGGHSDSAAVLTSVREGSFVPFPWLLIPVSLGHRM